MRTENRLPITIVTGFLGSGKTTVLSKVLKHPRFQNTSVIINEYGQAGLDHRLIRRIEEQTRLLSGGCICCNMREDLVNELKDILNIYERKEVFTDRVVIETTGLADPAPILFSILMDPILTNHFYVDFTVCCLDAANGELHLRENPESIKQIVTADKVIITKTDLVDEKTVAALRKRVQLLNPAAEVMTAANGNIDAEALFVRNEKAPEHTAADLNEIEQKLKNYEIKHNECVRSMSIKFYEPLEWTAFGLWMSMLLYAHGEKMFRIKGIVDVGDRGPIVINGVQHIIHPPQHLDDWNGEEKNSQIVFIMKDIEPQQIFRSLSTFQHMLGAYPQIDEINLNPFSGN